MFVYLQEDAADSVVLLWRTLKRICADADQLWQSPQQHMQRPRPFLTCIR